MKVAGWVELLWETIEQQRGVVFAYGCHDCCTFVARCLDAMHGSDRLAAILSEYHDEPSALALIAREGGMRGVVSHFLGDARPAHHARRGDVVLVRTPNGELVGVCTGNDVACAGDGVVMYPMSAAICAWCIDE